MGKEKDVVIIRETNFASYVADLLTFASICGAFWFNYMFIGGNDALDILLFICFFLFSVGRASNIKRQVLESTKEPSNEA